MPVETVEKIDGLYTYYAFITQLSQSESYRRTLVLKGKVLHQYAH